MARKEKGYLSDRIRTVFMVIYDQKPLPHLRQSADHIAENAFAERPLICMRKRSRV